jgi:hypothetical protein
MMGGRTNGLVTSRRVALRAPLVERREKIEKRTLRV